MHLNNFNVECCGYGCFTDVVEQVEKYLLEKLQEAEEEGWMHAHKDKEGKH